MDKKKILITAASSDIAKSLVDILLAKGYSVFATYRKNLPEKKEDFTPLFLDILDDKSFISFTEKISDIKFDAVINFAGVAVTSPVVKLSLGDLKFQFDTVVIGLLRLLQSIHPFLEKDSKVINISSMASFGIFPFISPYCASKAASDILLNSFEIETGIRTVSIKPGVVGTKFWQSSIDLNRDNFKNFDGEFSKTGDFLLWNAKKNSKKGLLPDDVSKVILKAVESKNPRHSYNIGCDARFASFVRFLPKSILNPVIRKVLNFRVEKFFKDGK